MLAGVKLLRTARDAAGAKVFIETGTHRGDGLAVAMRAPFEEYYSVELAPFAYGWCNHRFRKHRAYVHLHQGHSVPFLEQVLLPSTSIWGPIVFWLDAHWCGGDGEMEGRDNDLHQGPPLLDELRVIAQHRNKRHAILIDDVRNFGTELPTEESVRELLYAINPEYLITYADGVQPNDVLVALPPSLEEEGA